ncbi:polysaccharide biosynthesis/export family protein [Psychrobacter coccoides]|nr:polysaccharide biosynthesis/export family protein [Psychrobacter coccoides]
MSYNHKNSLYQSARLKGAMCLLLTGLLSGCTINSGLQAGQLPVSGSFIAENGLHFNIQPINLATLPPKKVATSNNDLHRLIQTSGYMDYQITQGDVLNIFLSGYPDITPSATSGFLVDQQGFVQFPLVGRVKASGLSVPQFTANLKGQLQRYLKYSDPQVNVAEYRGNKFFIDGEVEQPGEFAITDTPVSLYSAISLAGGATAAGDSNNITLNRDGKSYSLGLQSLRELGVSANQIYLRDGDSVHVNSETRNKVYVLGELGRVEPVLIPEQGLSLAHVIGESRGLDSNTSDAAKIYVVRDNPNNGMTNIYYIDMKTITNFALANRFEMQPNDILYVDPTGLARWNRVISLLLPSTSAIYSISRI